MTQSIESNLIQKYHLPVSGTSYGADLWDKDKHAVIEADVELERGLENQPRLCSNDLRLVSCELFLLIDEQLFLDAEGDPLVISTTFPLSGMR